MPIFESSCIGCHGPQNQRGGLRVDRQEDFFADNDNMPLILPGNAKDSRLIDIVSGNVKTMKSVSSHKLPEEKITLLKAWIDAGAEWP